jgi:hypothetical protein
MFPRQNSGIDNLPRLSKIETISQQNMNGVEIELEFVRGQTFTTGLSDWGWRFDPTRADNDPASCLPDLPAGHVYRTWQVTASFAATAYTWEFALPDQQASHISPSRIIDIVSEFFDRPGSFQVYLWGFEYQEENVAIWRPITRFVMNYQALPTRNKGSGVRVATYNGQAVLEFSNDGSDTYARLNQVLILAP